MLPQGPDPLADAYLIGRGSAPTIFYAENSKIGQKSGVLLLISSGSVGRNSGGCGVD